MAGQKAKIVRSASRTPQPPKAGFFDESRRESNQAALVERFVSAFYLMFVSHTRYSNWMMINLRGLA